MNARIQLQALVNLAVSDMHLADEERDLMYAIGKAHQVTQEEIDQMITQPQVVDNLDSLTDSDRFELLYNIVQLMKIDRKVYVVEIKYCENLAVRLGYNRKVIKELSAKIYANPAITTERSHLQELVRKHKED